MGRSTARGFTLIEFIMVLAVVGILIGLGLPNLQDMIVSARVKGAASDLHASLLYARSEAIKRNAQVSVAPTGGGAWTAGWEVMVVSSSEVLRSQDALSSLTVECPAATTCSQTVTYRGDGRLTAAVSQFVIDVPSPPTPRRIGQRCVAIGVSGQINVLADNNLDGDCNNG